MNNLNGQIIKYKMEYDSEDIMNFLEYECIDYLEELPDELWKLHKKKIQEELKLKTNVKIIEYIISKLKLKNLHKNFAKWEFDIVSFEYFKYIYETHTNQIDTIINNDPTILFDIFLDVFGYKNIEFNEYLFKNFIDKFNYRSEIVNLFSALIVGVFMRSDIKSHLNVYSKKCRKFLLGKYLYYSQSAFITLDRLEYYSNMLNLNLNGLMNNKKSNFNYLCNYFAIDSIDSMKKIQKMFNLSNEDISKLMDYDLRNFNASSNRIFIHSIIMTGNIKLLNDLINEYHITLPNLSDDFINWALYYPSIRGDMECVHNIYRIIRLIDKKILKQSVLDSVVYRLSHLASKSKYKKIKYIMYEFMKLGGKAIKCSPDIHQYQHSLRFFQV